MTYLLFEDSAAGYDLYCHLIYSVWSFSDKEVILLKGTGCNAFSKMITDFEKTQNLTFNSITLNLVESDALLFVVDQATFNVEPERLNRFIYEIEKSIDCIYICTMYSFEQCFYTFKDIGVNYCGYSNQFDKYQSLQEVLSVEYPGLAFNNFVEAYPEYKGQTLEHTLKTVLSKYLISILPCFGYRNLGKSQTSPQAHAFYFNRCLSNTCQQYCLNKQCNHNCLFIPSEHNMQYLYKNSCLSIPLLRPTNPKTNVSLYDLLRRHSDATINNKAATTSYF